MNYLPFVGYWFYGATDNEQRASFYNSWGLLEAAPAGQPPSIIGFFKLIWRPRRHR